MVFPRSRRQRPSSSNARDFRYSEDGLVLRLREVERTGSLRAGARHLGMDPGNGLRLIRSAESVLGAALDRGKTGGRRGGQTTHTPRGTRMARKRVRRDPPPTTRWRCHLVGSVLPRAPVLVAVPDAGVQVLVASAPGPWRSQGPRYMSGDEFELEIPSSAVTLSKFGGRDRKSV